MSHKCSSSSVNEGGVFLEETAPISIKSGELCTDLLRVFCLMGEIDPNRDSKMPLSVTNVPDFLSFVTDLYRTYLNIKHSYMEQPDLGSLTFL